ncbi:hypothetical protein LJR034_005228 [Caballeronia sp. LjRoot34]|uniref:IS4/Tn5 family transposase DNA-binding protein n=1 Tax=Caballeronia sp. LjRoot34 TaxID=3342325 RepID=UPI003ECC2A91
MAGKQRAVDRAWFEKEVEASEFQDARLRKRFGMVLERLWSGKGQTIPFACQDWASTKAAYRFLSNDRVSAQDILIGHFQANADRFRTTRGPILILQDTTTFSYQRERPELIGYTGKMSIKLGKNGSLRPLTQCGILMHSSLVVTTDGLPLGLAAVKFWTRSKFKGCTALKRHVNPTRVRLRRRRATAGWRTCASQRPCSATQCVASTLAIGKATFTNCFARRTTCAHTFLCEPVSTGSQAMVSTPLRMRVSDQQTHLEFDCGAWEYRVH